MDFIGGAGERLRLRLDVVVKTPWQSPFGPRTAVHFQDEQGRKVIWVANGNVDWLIEGELFDVAATIKEHAFYQGEPTTFIKNVTKK